MSNATEQFIRDLEDNYGTSIATIQVKNADYARGDDPFSNFRGAAAFADVSVERSILVRLGDKFARYSNLLERREMGKGGPEVSDESMKDTLIDIMGYVNILTVYEDWKTKPVEGYLYSGILEDYEGLEFIPEMDPLPPAAPVDDHSADVKEKLMKMFLRVKKEVKNDEVTK